MVACRRLLLFLALAAATTIWPGLCAATSDAVQEELVPGSAASAIYGFNQLASLHDDMTLVFDYRLEGEAVENPVTDRIALHFSQHSAQKDKNDAAFSVEATVFEQTRKQVIPSIFASRVNPILLIFFQHDVTQMNRKTGGSSHYFRNAIRQALRTPIKGGARPETVKFGGRSVPAKLITLKPFKTDVDRQRMSSFAGKIYRIIVSEEVPGGVYEIQTEVPGDSGKTALLRETYRFKDALQ